MTQLRKQINNEFERFKTHFTHEDLENLRILIVEDIEDNRTTPLKEFKKGETIPHVPGFLGSALNVDDLLSYFEEPFTPTTPNIVEYNTDVRKYLTNSFFIKPKFKHEDNISLVYKNKNI